MHIDCRICGFRPEGVSRIWFYKWGFGIWLRNVLFGIGHDTRSRIFEPEPYEPDFCVCDYQPRRKCSVHPKEE
jgi:hypothetical protein